MTILVAGATGTVGRHVVHHLLEAGQQVRALTRNPARARLPEQVEVVAGNLADIDSLAHALDSVTALHLINFDGGTGGLLPNGAELIQRAKEAGVQRVTVLLGGEKGSLEQALEASGLEWTFLAPVEFMMNALEWTDSIRAEGVVRDPLGDRRTAAIHEGDIGAVAAKVLVAGGHARRTLTLTGPEVLTPREMVQTIGETIGRPIQFVELTKAQARERWQAAGFSSQDIEFFEWALYNTPEAGYTVVPTVEQVTGRPARTFRQWAVEHADAFRS
jgi:uncharacterized protein YbjT (DUF2867 family)